MNLSKTSFVRYGCVKDIFCMLWMTQRRLLYVIDVSKTSFVRYGGLKDVFCMLWMSQKRPKDVLRSLGMLYANYTKSLVYQSRVFFCRRVLLSCDELKAQGS